MIIQFMKNKVLIPLVVVGALAGFFSFKYIGDGNGSNNNDRKDLVVNTVMKAIKEGHFAPRDINDSFSNRIYLKVLDNLDPEKRFFTKAEINQLSAFQYKLDDEILSGHQVFFDQLNNTYNKAIDRADAYQKELLKTPYTFTGTDRIQLTTDKSDYATDDAALKERWKKYIQFRVLAKYVELKKDRDKPAEKDKTKDKEDKKEVAVKEKPKNDTQLEVEARESIGKNLDRFFVRFRKITYDERFAVYVNAITGSEDPHTDYFPPEDKKRFDEQMSGSFFGIGAALKEEEGKIKITNVMAGTPSWKQGDLKAGDEIQKVGQGSAVPDDIQGFEVEDVVKKIRGPKGTEVRLTVKRVDGSIKVIPIIRGEVSIEETFAKSAIIKSLSGPVGYIYLPEFYNDFSGNGSKRKCAEDVAIEIGKLKNAGVTGIILDLRWNGGGSLSDVVDMGGFFIDQGPIVQVKSSDADPMMLRDGAKGTLYDGPLVIMVNQYSASASEIMAAAMQDYKRAVIVGAPTYGKGTVQKVIPLDEFISPVKRMQMQAAGEEPLGSLKITVQKFYRINGNSTQLRGVVPDVRFPDPYEMIDQGERKDKAALAWDEIPAANYRPANSVNVPQIAALSEKRIAANPSFNIIRESAKEIKAKELDNSYSLNENTYRSEMEKASVISKKLEELQKKGTPYTVVSPQEDMAKINVDKASKEKNALWIKNLQKDIYIAETVNIINDMAKQPVSVNIGTGMK